jgi:zinc protease
MDMLTKGTKSRTAKQLAEQLESNAIELSGSASMDTASVSLSAMLPQLDLAMELFADVLRNPTFPKDEFDILQPQARMGLMVQTKTPEYLAERELRRQLYGSHPYSRTSSGELEDLDNLKIDDLQAWWSKNLRPDNAVLYVGGDITPDAAYKLAEKYLAAWKAEGKFEPPKLGEPPAKQKTHIYIVDKPGSTQSQIRAGHLGIKRDHPRYIISRVLSDIFGGSFNSRLNKAIRVEKGLTYGAHGGLSPRRFGGDFGVGTFTKTESTAVTVQTIVDEITKIRSAPPGEQELSDTKTYIAGSFAGNRETPMSIVGDLWMIETQNLPDDYLQKLLAGVKAAEGPQIMESAKELIDPDHLVFVVVGEASKIKAGLEKIAPVTVISPAPEKGEEPPSAAAPASRPASQPAPKKKAA